jgi:hypothetical protein
MSIIVDSTFGQINNYIKENLNINEEILKNNKRRKN